MIQRINLDGSPERQIPEHRSHCRGTLQLAHEFVTKSLPLNLNQIACWSVFYIWALVPHLFTTAPLSAHIPPGGFHERHGTTIQTR